MDIQPKTEEGCVRSFTVTFPLEELAGHEDEIVRKVRSEATIKGFRPGKAPADLIKVRFAKLIREEIFDKLLPEAVEKIQKEHKVKPAVDPYVKDVEGEREEPITCEIVFEVAPEVPELSDLATEVTIDKVEVTEEQVKNGLEGLRQQAASVKAVESAAEEGDFVEVHLLRKQQRVPKPVTLHRAAKADSDNILDRKLMGRNSGEIFSLLVEEPAESASEKDEKDALAPGEYEVTVSRILRRELPETDEDLAKHFGEEKIEGLREKVEADLKNRTEARKRQEIENRAVEWLLQRYPFPVPPTLVERQLHENVNEMGQNFARQGIDPKTLQWEEIAKSMKGDSELQVKRYFLLEDIASRENFDATEEDLNRYFEQHAASSGQEGVTAQKVRAAYEKEKRLDSLRTFIRHQKVLDLLVKRASITIKEEVPPSKEDADGAHSDRSGADE